jgi:hypothetical protein
LRRTKRLSAATLTSALILGSVAFPALAINDGRVPTDECSGNPSAVGTPQGNPNPGLAVSDPVSPPASENNPGQPTGARGEDRSRAGDHC